MLSANSFFSPNAALLVIPLLAAASLAVMFRKREYWQSGGGWRDAIIAAMISLMAGIVISTECLGIVGVLNSTGVLLVWAAVACAGVGMSFRIMRKCSASAILGFPGKWESILWVLVALVILTLLVIALAAAPSNWDSMTYHLCRICHWLQNGNVDHYATHNLRQLYLGPFAEFCGLHVIALTGSDNFVTLVQWSCMVGACIVASLVARQLGAGNWGQALAALICVTIPMGMLQSSSTQNDYVAAFLVLCSIHYLLSMKGAWKMSTVVLGASSAGLALLTKPTTMLYIGPFIAFAVAPLLHGKVKWSRALLLLLLVVAIATGLNAGYMWRNFDLFGAPLGVRAPVNPDIYSNEFHGWQVFVSNALRNSALHMQSPFTGVQSLILKCVEGAHAIIGIGMNDARTTFAGTRFGASAVTTTQNGDLTGNTLHALLFVVSLVVLAKGRFFKQRKHLLLYAGCLCLSFLVFCGYLKWQPWHSRLHLPLFVVAAPLVGVIVSELFDRRIAVVTAGLLLLLSLPWLLRCSTRPLLAKQNILNTPRLVQYFVERPQLMQGYVSAAIELAESEHREVGLIISGDDWEYPLWGLLRAGGASLRIRHVAVENVSKRLQQDQSSCDVLVRIDNAGRTVQVIEVP